MTAPTILVRYLSAYFELWAVTVSSLPSEDWRYLVRFAETNLKQLTHPSASVVSDLLLLRLKRHPLTTPARAQLHKLMWGLSIVAELSPDQRSEVSQSVSICLNKNF